METCHSHEELMEVLTRLTTNLEWVVRIGKGFLSLFSVTVLAFIPLIFYMHSEIRSLDARLNHMEQKNGIYNRSLPELP